MVESEAALEARISHCVHPLCSLRFASPLPLAAGVVVWYVCAAAQEVSVKARADWLWLCLFACWGVRVWAGTLDDSFFDSEDDDDAAKAARQEKTARK